MNVKLKRTFIIMWLNEFYVILDLEKKKYNRIIIEFKLKMCFWIRGKENDFNKILNERWY